MSDYHLYPSRAVSSTLVSIPAIPVFYSQHLLHRVPWSYVTPLASHPFAHQLNDLECQGEVGFDLEGYTGF